MNKIIYLDHNATTPVDERVFKAMEPYLREKWGNASSVHEWGVEARYAIEKARLQTASLIEANPENLIFTSGGTESNHLLIHMLVSSCMGKGCHIVSSQIEHPSVLRLLQHYEALGTAEVAYVKPDTQGITQAEDVEKAIRDNTRLVSLMYANNETGVLQPVKEVCERLKGSGIPVHTDAVQALGKIPFDVLETGVDYASFSAHKVYGPKGVGALYLADASQLEPLFRGGGQEMGLRAGTENVAGCVGFGAAAEIAHHSLKEDIEHQARIRDRLEKLLHAIHGASIIGHEAARLPNTTCICIKGLRGTYATLDLAREGIGVSSGSACSANKSEPSHVLLAMGLEPRLASGAIRFSLGRSTHLDEMEIVVEALKKIIDESA